MGVNTLNLIQGPATLYAAVFGATEEATVSAPLSAPWVDVGGTMGGVTVKIAQEYSDLEVDQIPDVPETRLVKRSFSIETNLAEATLSNLKLTLNGGTLTIGVAPADDTYEPDAGDSTARPAYIALALEGQGDKGFKRRLYGRKMLSTAGSEFAYQKDGQNVLKVTWSGFYVSPSIRPFRVSNAKA